MESIRRRTGHLRLVGQLGAAAGMVLLLTTCATPAVSSFGVDKPVAGTASCSTTSAASAPDPIVTDGDKYHVVLENEHVRVLRYHDKPGDRTLPHHHDEFVLYTISAFRRRLTFPDGTVKERDFNPGEAIWMPDQVHTGENIGSTDTDVVIVEQKPTCSHPRRIRAGVGLSGGADGKP
jgi:beta-alanine degradation protein BauB